MPDKDRALVVEDCRTIAAILRHYLQLDGFDVLVEVDGASGLETARREQPRLIVTDLNLPGMGGLEMVKALRADDRTKDISIFMLTSDESPESESLARAVGADDYIFKPVQRRDLSDRVRAVMGRTERVVSG